MNFTGIPVANPLRGDFMINFIRFKKGLKGFQNFVYWRYGAKAYPQRRAARFLRAAAAPSNTATLLRRYIDMI